MTTQAVTRNPLIWILPLAVGICTFLIWPIYWKAEATTEAEWVALLPAANALFNALCACCLVGGWVNIKHGKRKIHISFMLSAVVFSGLFLVSYVVYHHFHGDTPFPGRGLVRPVYFFILFSHVMLSVVTLPMVFSTLHYAATRQFQTHRKIARYTLPVWLYVSVTGVMVFLFLRAYT